MSQCKDSTSFAQGATFRKPLDLAPGDHYFVVDTPAHATPGELMFGVAPIRLR
jgi:hypothetical protein